MCSNVFEGFCTVVPSAMLIFVVSFFSTVAAIFGSMAFFSKTQNSLGYVGFSQALSIDFSIGNENIRKNACLNKKMPQKKKKACKNALNPWCFSQDKKATKKRCVKEP